MRGFDSRDGLVDWLEKNIARKAIVRAMDEGTVEVMGGFSTISPTTFPGWIVRVTSIHKKIWNIAILAANGKLEIRIINKLPWGMWAGEHSENTLYTGDYPKQYKEFRDAKKSKG